MPQDPKKPKTWKDLKKSPKLKKTSLSFYARLKIFLAYLKYSFILALLVCIGIASYILYKTETINNYMYNDSQRIKNFIFKQDKNITGKWLWDFTEIKALSPLDSIDIFEIKERIEALKQIDSVVIEKIYPDSLKISIREKDSMAKCYIDGKILIISTKGELYEPICISQEIIAKLIELSDLKLEKDANSYVNIEKALKIQELLALAKNTEGINFDSWQKINMQKANYLVEPLMEIHTLDDIKIIFSFDNFKEQLLKLKSTLEFSKNNAVRFAQIDLALKDRADVKIRKEQ